MGWRGELPLLWTAQGFGAVSVSSREGEGRVIQAPLATLGFPSSSSQCHQGLAHLGLGSCLSEVRRLYGSGRKPKGCWSELLLWKEVPSR